MTTEPSKYLSLQYEFFGGAIIESLPLGPQVGESGAIFLGSSTILSELAHPDHSNFQGGWYYNTYTKTNSKREIIVAVRISKCLRKYFCIIKTYHF